MSSNNEAGTHATAAATESHQYQCEECDWKGTIGEMAVIDDVAQRVLPGELMAAGCCPLCGALIGVDDCDVPEYTLTATDRILAHRGEGQAARLAQVLDSILKCSSIDPGGLVALNPDSSVVSAAVVALAEYHTFARRQ